MRLKLLVDNRTKKVLFAEAGKDFVDFLLGLQQIPLGCIIALLKGSGVPACGSFSRVYQSIVDLDPTHLQPGTDIDALLRPKVFSSPNIHTPLANYFVIEESSSTPAFDAKRGAPLSVHIIHTSSGPSFSPSTTIGPSRSSLSSLDSRSNSQQIGWVRDGEMFMVKDDLVIQPLSPISAIALLNIFHIKDLSSLEEKTVNFGIQEVLTDNLNVFFYPF
uniref:Uncharacterized protein LOC103332687 n=1 Tax=Rhizophora mucronata TaxID=61149 RepID=A0A2P2IN49_RHIMU